MHTIFTTVFIHPHFNNLDSTSNKSNTTKIVLNNEVNSGRKIDVKRSVIEEINNASVVEKDSIASVSTAEKQLFTVPYRCTLNRDSLRAEMHKVVLEIDTIPKGLTLIINENATDTTQIGRQVFTKSIFSNHLLKPSSKGENIKANAHQNWMFLILLLTLFLIAILRVFYQKKFTLFINAIISKRFSNQIIRDENALTQSTSVVLTFVFFISLSLFFYLVTNHFHQNLMGLNGFQKFAVILIGCFSFYFLKLLLNKLGGYIFKVYKETDEYIFNQFIILQVLGLLLIIFCILLNYSIHIEKEVIIYLGFSSLIIGFVIRMIKSVGIANMNTYSPVYIFLYLCTLEILPLIIIVKLIVR